MPVKRQAVEQSGLTRQCANKPLTLFVFFGCGAGGRYSGLQRRGIIGSRTVCGGSEGATSVGNGLPRVRSLWRLLGYRRRRNHGRGMKPPLTAARACAVKEAMFWWCKGGRLRGLGGFGWIKSMLRAVEGRAKDTTPTVSCDLNDSASSSSRPRCGSWECARGGRPAE